jgi:membrane protease YdiL (CAAX protease family)
MHMQIVQIIPIFILGFALAVIYQATGRIWIAMLLHATNNVIQVVSLMHNNEFAWGGLWILIPLLVALLLFRKIIVSPGFRQINKDLS